MPRIRPSLIRHARRINPLLPSLLPVCRDLRSAQNELRWLGEHAAKLVDRQRGLQSEQDVLHDYVSRRARGEPLQYILGTEYFGNLEIKCRPGVLIPRQETAASVSHLVHLLSKTWVAGAKTEKLEQAKREAQELECERQEAEKADAENRSAEKRAFEKREADEWKALLSWARSKPKGPGVPKSLTVLDLCTGTGCIPLLFASELFSHPELSNMNARFIGADVSPTALKLADKNLRAQRRSESAPHGALKGREWHPLRYVQFLSADLLADTFKTAFHKHYRTTEAPYVPKCDILISNPPYISSEGYRRTTSSSVRRYEPKLALVPPGTASKHDGDVFYPRLLEEAKQLQAKIFLFEVADLEQAKRVAHLVLQQGLWKDVEIWRDDPAASSYQAETVNLSERAIRVFGEGHGRSVVAYRAEGREWLGRERRDD